MRLYDRFNTSNLRGDLLGGLTAAVVALPLALAFGNAALGPGGAIYGLYGAIVTGFIAAICGGTPAQVSGPTGPMSVTVAGVVSSLAAAGVARDLGAGEILPMVMAAVVVGGLLEMALGVLKLGRYITLVPYSVVSGFMSGIGFIILVLQIGPFLGIQTSGGVISSLSQLTLTNSVNGAAIGIGMMTLAVVFLTPARIRQWVPSPLLALLIVTPISILFFDQDAMARIGSIPEGGLQFRFPEWRYHIVEILKAGGVLALLGAIDSLLTSLVADNITQTEHDSNQELIGQGIANTASGLLGGLPGAGATMRTVINIKSGGKTPLSGMTHSAVLLLVLIGAGGLAEQIPTALLAGILIKVGLDIIDWGFLFKAHRLSAKTAALMYGVLLMTVFWDLIWGVLVGMFVANLLTVDSITQVQLEGIKKDNADGERLRHQSIDQVMILKLRGPLSFGAAKGISSRMGLIKNYKALILDLADVPRVGVTASLAIERIVHEAESHTQQCLIVSGTTKVVERLRRVGVTGDFIDSMDAAIEKAIKIVREPERGSD
ncbi:MAG: sodium-independent anion transporter [Synechococcus sp. ARS1019]|nr:sodium-independent anion transporter [Synechococcus sp. ARS1019]|tara:strand:+ start:6939 stop:8576 length:1638 start_codon:yes stop_codon:yes gene_type:complete